LQLLSKVVDDLVATTIGAEDLKDEVKGELVVCGVNSGTIDFNSRMRAELCEVAAVPTANLLVGVGELEVEPGV